MKKIIIFAFLLFLAGCLVPEPPAQETQQAVIPVKIEQEAEKQEFKVPVAYSYVHQDKIPGTVWGFDENKNLIFYNSSEKTAVFEYEDEKLVRIILPNETTEITYNEFGPELIKQDNKEVAGFRYNSKGQLIEWAQGIDTYSFTFDSKNRLSSYFRGNGQMTQFIFDDKNRTKKIKKGSSEITTHFDKDNRLARFDREDDHWVFVYWREDLLSGMSGTMYGVGETITYGVNTIRIVSNTAPAEFRSETPETRQEALNILLFCTRFRKLPVLFDWSSWVISNEYLKMSLADYVIWSQYCGVL